MDIAKIFKSKTRKELFRLYFTNPDNEYYLRELERLLDIPVSMIRNELMNLEGDGIFISRKKGNSIYYSLDKTYPLFDEIKSIVFKTLMMPEKKLEPGKKEKLILLAKKCARLLKSRYKVKKVFLIGSLVKGPFHKKSDIDLVVEGLVPELYIKALTELYDLLPAGIELNLIPFEDAFKHLKENTLKEGGTPLWLIKN